MSSPSSEAVDRVCQMDDEDFKCVMEELTGHRPQSDLVRGLCADAAKDESFQTPAPVRSAPRPTTWSTSRADQQPSLRKTGNNSRNNRSLRPDASQGPQKQQSDQSGVNSQSMQDLVSMECKSSGGKNSRKHQGSKMRANSFTQDDDDNGTNGAVDRKASSTKTRNRSSATPVPSSVSPDSLISLRNVLLKSQSSASSAVSGTHSQSPAAGTATSSATSPAAGPAVGLTPRLSSTDTTCSNKLTTTHNNSSNNNNVNNSDCDVESSRSSDSRLFTPSLRTYSNPCHSSSISSNNNASSSNSSAGAGGSGRTGQQAQLPVGPQPVHICREENVVEVMDNMVEMCDMQQRAHLVNYTKLANGCSGATSGPVAHDVDSVVPFSRLEAPAGPSAETQYAEKRILAHDPSPYNAFCPRPGNHLILFFAWV